MSKRIRYKNILLVSSPTKADSRAEIVNGCFRQQMSHIKEFEVICIKCTWTEYITIFSLINETSSQVKWMAIQQLLVIDANVEIGESALNVGTFQIWAFWKMNGSMWQKKAIREISGYLINLNN